jgi:hypothetical protein
MSQKEKIMCPYWECSLNSVFHTCRGSHDPATCSYATSSWHDGTRGKEKPKGEIMGLSQTIYVGPVIICYDKKQEPNLQTDVLSHTTQSDCEALDRGTEGATPWHGLGINPVHTWDETLTNYVDGPIPAWNENYGDYPYAPNSIPDWKNEGF